MKLKNRIHQLKKRNEQSVENTNQESHTQLPEFNGGTKSSDGELERQTETSNISDNGLKEQKSLSDESLSINGELHLKQDKINSAENFDKEMEKIIQSVNKMSEQPTADRSVSTSSHQDELKKFKFSGSIKTSKPK